MMKQLPSMMIATAAPVSATSDAVLMEMHPIRRGLSPCIRQWFPASIIVIVDNVDCERDSRYVILNYYPFNRSELITK